MLQLNDVRFGYANKKVLNGITAGFQKDLFYCILGPSGQGKSTLLKIIAGFYQPSSGTIYFDSEAKQDSKNSLNGSQNCGFVLQGGSLFDHLRVDENISIQALQAKWPQIKIQERLEYLCRITRFPAELLKRHPNKLSGGQKQRAAIMRALFMDPELILLDEAFNGLDLILKIDLLHELKDVFKNLKKTVIMVTHDLIEARILADQILIIQDGVLVENASRLDFFKSPQSELGQKLIQANEFGQQSK